MNPGSLPGYLPAIPGFAVLRLGFDITVKKGISLFSR
jgi:hypothetical protein